MPARYSRVISEFEGCIYPPGVEFNGLEFNTEAVFYPERRVDHRFLARISHKPPPGLAPAEARLETRIERKSHRFFLDFTGRLRRPVKSGWSEMG